MHNLDRHRAFADDDGRTADLDACHLGAAHADVDANMAGTANLHALRAVLEPLDQNLIVASSGTQALRQVLEHDFAVILLDVQMPDMSGIEAAAMIREGERSKTTPIIFLTGVVKTAEMMFKGYSAGAVDYLMKPVVSGVLRAKVEVAADPAPVFAVPTDSVFPTVGNEPPQQSNEYPTMHYPNTPVGGSVAKSKVAAGVLAILLGWLGVHRFYLGYKVLGFIMLGLSIVSVGRLIPLTLLWGVVEGILIFVGVIKTDKLGSPLS